MDWVPEPHQAFLRRAQRVLGRDGRILGVAIGGSYITREMDEDSDLDLMLVVEDPALTRDTEARMVIARQLGDLLAGFSGEHVGEPRMLICLYDNPLLHVDLKFVTPKGLERRIEDPVILFERGTLLRSTIAAHPSVYPRPDLQWIEDRFWVWIHYAASKLRRGELFEAKSTLDFLVTTALGPLSATAVDRRASGVRRLERYGVPELKLLANLCLPYNLQTVAHGFLEAATLYRSLRDRVADDTLIRREAAESASMRFLDLVVQRVDAMYVDESESS